MKTTMEEKQNPVQSSGNEATEARESKQECKKESKANAEKRNQHILEFVRGLAPYECEAFRVMVDIAYGKTTVDEISVVDRLCVNRFLNNGYTKEMEAQPFKVLAHRQANAQKLLKTISEFMDNSRYYIVSCALMTLSSDQNDIDNLVANHNSLPNSQKNTAGNNQTDAFKNAQK